MAAPHHRTARRRRQPGRVPGAHQARTLPGSGVLLHPEGPADRPAPGRDAHRLRLCRAHGCRQLGGGREDQRPHGAAAARTLERRRGGDQPLGRRLAPGRLGIPRGDGQGPLGHPPGDPRGGAAAICRPRQADPRTGLRARGQELFRGQAARRPAPPRPLHHGGRVRRRGARRDVLRRRRARGLSRPPGGAPPLGRAARRHRRGAARALPRPDDAPDLQRQRRASPDAIPIRGLAGTCPSPSPPTAARCRGTGSSASSRRASA